MNTQIKSPLGRSLGTSLGTIQPPNFPTYRQGRFTLELEAYQPLPELDFLPLRPRSGSGQVLSAFALLCKTGSGAVAGGCAVSLPPGRGDFPSPKQAPHPVLGEWLSALRCTGLSWLECGSIAVAPGFPEEGVAELLWEGLLRLLRRNGTTFLIGAEPVASLALDMVVRRGARILEPFHPAPIPQYFLYVDP